MIRILSIFTFSIFLLGSCVVGPNYERPEVPAPDSWGNEHIGNQDSILNLRWWELFGNPDLDSLIVTGLRENKDVLIAASRIDQAAAYLGFTQADMKPRFDYSGGVDYGTSLFPGSDGPEGFYNVGGTINWEINFWGKFKRANQAAQAELVGSEFGLRSVQISLISAIAEAYFQLIDFKWRLNIAQQTLLTREESMRIVRLRFEQGIVPEIDLNQAQIQTAIAASSIPFYQRQIGLTENVLQLLLGRNPGAIDITHNLDTMELLQDIPAGIPSTILQRRPDIMQAEQYAIAATANVGYAEALRYPSINLTGLLGVASPALSSAANNSPLWWSVGGTISGPIFHFQKNKRRVEVERHKARQALLDYEFSVIQSFKEVEDALISIETLKRELFARGDQVTASVKARDLSQERYDKGVTSYLEVLETERSAFEAELQYASTKQQLFSAYVLLYKALGGGWISAEEEQEVLQQQQE